MSALQDRKLCVQLGQELVERSVECAAVMFARWLTRPVAAFPFCHNTKSTRGTIDAAAVRAKATAAVKRGRERKSKTIFLLSVECIIIVASFFSCPSWTAIPSISRIVFGLAHHHPHRCFRSTCNTSTFAVSDWCAVFL